MTDKEVLDLIEYYKWNIKCIDTDKNKGWEVSGKFGFIFLQGSLRDTINMALAAQAKWALS